MSNYNCLTMMILRKCRANYEELTSLINTNEVTSEVASVYMEIGIQVGVKLMMEMMGNMNRAISIAEGDENKY